VKVLLDACVWGRAKEEIREAGHEVEWAGDWPEDPGDDEILARAHSEGRVLVTPDKDFGELAVARRAAHCGIVRLVGVPATLQAPAVLAMLREHGGVLAEGAILTFEPGRVRIRRSGREA